ncbi:1-phosphofructokinase family hexose kinase [Actinokineospora sp. HUAS TT18]|uniref:1-phosphofructokinase family hexose kinase n=1 Tax=Actinokineospora sp. HUAS TT18 TaxID=3447451 RepID=UPI003F520612
MTDAVAVFVPAPDLTMTIENVDGSPDIHLHAGGQGVWQARMASALGADVVLAATFGGETGHVVRTLIEPALTVRELAVAARNGAYVHDRREGEREQLVRMNAEPLTRHELDDLYELALIEGMKAGVAILSGPQDDGVLPDSLYRRLTADLTGNGCLVVVDLSGSRLAEAHSGGPTVIKVSDEEIDGDPLSAGRDLASTGARIVVISRGADPSLVFHGDEVLTIEVPSLEPVDTSGGGDSITAALAYGLAADLPIPEILRLAGAAGALNVTRHGLGTGDGAAVRHLSERVRVRPLAEEP